MKFFYLLLFLLFLIKTNAQETVFDNEINSSIKVSEDYYKMSSKLIYCSQPKFILEQNLRIPLINNKIIIAKYTSTSTLKVGSVSYIYKIENDIEGLVVFTVYKNFLVGSIILGTGEKFHISQVADTIFSFLQFNPNFFTNEECASETQSEKNSKKEIDKIQTNSQQEKTTAYNVCTDAPCPNSVVDVMIFFSNQIIASLTGGETEAVAGISNQVVIGNQGYINSGINNLQLNIVYARALNFNDGVSLSADKAILSTSPAIQALRNQYHADLVSLLTNYGSGIGDQPKNPTNFSSDAAYSAISYGYAVGYYSFLHETGHNLGIRHDWHEYQADAADIADGNRPCSWHHGYTNQAAIAIGTASADSTRWRTILSYSGNFNSAGLGNGFRINRWSNPDLLYNGHPMGIAASASIYPANEKFALERTGCIVAGFRTGIVPTNCPDPPTGVSSQSVCSSSNFSALIVTGTAIQWYSSPTFGTPINQTSIVVAGTYYASQTVNGCESPRLAVTVTINSCVTLSGSISGNASTCQGNPVQLSIAFTGQGPWSGTLSDGTSFSGTVTPLIITKYPIVSTTYTIATLSNGITTATSGHMVGSAVITIKESPQLTTITASGSTTLCLGGRVNLTASARSSSYIVTNNSNIGFIDIATTGLSIGTLSNESKHVISIPSFLYNNISYTSATVFNNGVLVFGNESGNMGPNNGSLPSSLTGLTNPAAICAMWDDLIPGAGTSIKTATVDNKFIIQWTNEYQFSYQSTGSVTFQIQLDKISGQIHLVYPDVIYGNTIIDNGKTATIGLNFNATSALQYSWGSGSLTNNQSITYSPYIISWSSGQTTPTIAVSTAGNYSVTVTNSSGCSATSAVTTITIDNSCITPTATISGNTSICLGSSAQLNVAITGQGPWSGTLSDGTVFSGSVSPISVSVSPTTSTIYTIATLSNATAAITSEYLYDNAYVTINPPPSLPIITASASTNLCQGSSVNLTVSNMPNTYNVNTNSNVSFIDISSTGASIGSVDDESSNVITIPNFIYNNIPYTTATIFNNGVLVFGNETGDVGYSNSNLPSIFDNVTNPAAICAMWDDLIPGSNGSIKTATVNNKFIIQWTNELHFDYQSLGTITFQIQLDLQTGQVHLVYQDVYYGNSNIDYGKSATIGLNLNATSALQYSYNIANLINNKSITYTPSFPIWSSGQTTPTITVSAAGDYTVLVTNNNGCSATSAATTVIVNQIPPQPSVATPQSVCTNNTVSDLVVTNTNIKWYAALTGGTALATTTALATSTYFASQTINGCESVSRLPVNVFVNPCENYKVGIKTLTPNSTLELNGSFGRKTTKITSSTSLTINNSIILSDSGFPLTVTLPSAMNIKGRDYIIKNINSGIVTISTLNSELIDSQTTISLLINQSITIISDGINWKIIKFNN